MNTPLVSIIIPTYNRAHLIGETLDSIIAQTYTNWECIVVDDGSTDNTEQLLNDYCKKDTRFQYHHRPKERPKGANACRNYGFELSKGEYINWFDSDDLMHCDKLLIQIDALESSNFNFSVCQSVFFKDDIHNIEGLRSENIISETIFYDYMTQKIAWLTQAPMWKRNFLNSLSFLFDEELQAAQEWEFHCRVLSVFPEYHTINNILVFLRKHNQSITYNDNDNNRQWFYFLARNKIYKNSIIKKDNITKLYLQNYLLSNFKLFVINRQWFAAWFSLKKFILVENEFKLMTKLNAFLGFISYSIFNKGYYFIKRVKFIK
ncbi:glycosyltransferase family 2 protein [Lutibacter sp. HS1-25]|uniref:glycosyltransferase family 2 protein n=1 Tax=Lutibacter sp. HS1-25 TaxID=2485000 RepID=UPI001011065E|nr:glycosyltransferase family 2 protein [Lutibacter sp. HS1-25]RXP52577.1 glycosyltransferase family 2 protein [Lutibacter sp. HS1-25]